ncbi:olfactory receptor 10J5-like [Amia ocellicauda]|uniref:olfactory receptor 10J5-like n=1 Tax=Amia ocellicauda TaxID=2972642 RepID=UPI00346414D4
MENQSFTAFTFTIFGDISHFKYAYFFWTLLGYLLIIYFNVMLVSVIFLERSLHEPMYIFICSLSLNSLCGTAAVFPRLLADLVSDTHTISRAGCFTQIFFIYTYVVGEFTTLTVMAYDRYVAICKPLQYNSIMSPRHIILLLAVAWLYPVFCEALVIIFSSRLPLCGNQIERVFCSNWSVVRLSCIPTTANNIVGFFVTVTTVFLPLGYILYSYMSILIVCSKDSKDFRKKALQTCLPHIITFSIYSISTFSEIVLSRFESVIKVVSIIVSLEFLVIPPLLNPLIYGMNLPEIRKRIINRLRSKKNTITTFPPTARN